MIIYCEHIGRGEDASGPISEIDTRMVVHQFEVHEGTLTATLDPIDSGAAHPRLDAYDNETHRRLTVSCTCGWAFSARWLEWIDYLVKIGAVERLEIGVAKRTYEAARRASRPGFDR